MMQLEPAHLSIIQTILQKHLPLATVYLFGSRAANTAKKFSDIDLLVQDKNPLSLALQSALREDFSKSALPFTVDIVDAQTVTSTFRTQIMREAVRIKN
jgi:predicted nucleotidyltransferase